MVEWLKITYIYTKVTLNHVTIFHRDPTTVYHQLNFLLSRLQKGTWLHSHQPRWEKALYKPWVPNPQKKQRKIHLFKQIICQNKIKHKIWKFVCWNMSKSSFMTLGLSCPPHSHFSLHLKNPFYFPMYYRKFGRTCTT